MHPGMTSHYFFYLAEAFSSTCGWPVVGRHSDWSGLMALRWRGSGVDLDEALHMRSINLQYSKSGCENN